MKITVSFSGVIPIGEFENERPTFGLEEEVGYSDLSSVLTRQDELYGACRTMFERAEQQSLVKKIQKAMEGVKITTIDGIPHPSVTSVISWDFKPDDNIKAKGFRGNIIHAQIEDYWQTKEWKDATKISACFDDIVSLKKLNAEKGFDITWDNINFLNFLKNYPIEPISFEVNGVNKEHRYTGKPDLKGIPKGEKWEKLEVAAVPTLFDYKTGSFDEWRHFKQGTAYWHLDGNEDIQQFVIIPLDGEPQQGFSKPKVLTNKDKYWDAFLKDRERFKKLFGV